MRGEGGNGIKLSGVGHHFAGSSWLFRGVDYSFQAGSVYALTGPSGSGKSTLLSLIAGWVTPVEGQILSDGVGEVRWVFQNPHGVPSRTAIDHVVLPILARGVRRQLAEIEAREYMEEVSLGHIAERPFSMLSGGEAQRLMLARGMASRPGVLLVDEPTAQLDLATGVSVNAALSKLTARDTVVIVATHDRRTVDSCDAQLRLEEFAVAEPVEARQESS